MTTIYGTSNWRLTIECSHSGITILRAVTCDRCAVLPEELCGLPVTALSDRAFSREIASGEEICITCGTPDTPWDNRKMQELHLPATLRSVGDYALFNCRELHTLHLYDNIQSWGVSALMNCRSLHRILLQCTTPTHSDTLAYLTSELSGELDVSLFRPDRQQVRLIFPEYIENYEENSPAHHFDYVIYGAGHPYHHIFRGRTIHLADFDGLWARFLAVEHDDSAALALAWWRLRYPCELSNDARQQYEAYLRTRIGEALCLTLETRDMDGLRQLLKMAPPAEELSAALSLAREMHLTEASVILLEQQHRFHQPKVKTFDL